MDSVQGKKGNLPSLLKLFVAEFRDEGLGAAWWQFQFRSWDILVYHFRELDKIRKLFLDLVLIIMVITDSYLNICYPAYRSILIGHLFDVPHKYRQKPQDKK